MAVERHRSVPQAASRASHIADVSSFKDGNDHELLSSMDDVVSRRGLLSRTLIQSPTIHAILPGKIRHKELNDVVFIGDRFIQLLELQRTGFLEEVEIKTDFGSSILAAKVIGSSEHEAEDFVDVVVKQEHKSEDGDFRADRDSAELPPQLLVLVLESKEVLFLYARNNRHGSVDFHVARRVLPIEVSTLSRYGELLAVDVKSRAIAVGASQGHFGIMSLKSMEQIRSERAGFDNDPAVMPITEERFFRVDGHILQMDFLLPSIDHSRSAILALLVSKNATTHILLYEWDTTLGLQHSSNLVGCSGQRLDPADTVPLMLIPSALTTSFMLVCEHGLASYSNVLGRTAYRKSVSLPYEALNNFRNSSSVPLWTQWARPQRHILRRGTHDDFYLCREDGLLHFVEIQKTFGEEESIRVSLHFNTGSLRCNVDKAFAVMGGSLDDVADVLLAAGDMSDGGVYHCMPRDSPTCHQTIANWAPLIDFLVVRDRKTVGSNGRDRIFACAGRGEGYGAVTELRTGLEAKTGLIVEHEDAISMTGIWVLPDLYNNRLILLAGHPLYSSSITLNMATFEIEVIDEALPGLDLSSPTLTAAIIQHSILFQVTPSAIIACSIMAEADEVLHYGVGGETISFAAVTSNGPPTVVYVAKDLSPTPYFRLRLRRFQLEGKDSVIPEIEATATIPFEATSLCVCPIMSDLLICVGSADGKVSFFHGGSQLSLVDEIRLTTDVADLDISSLDSLAIIRPPGDFLGSLLLIGGFRNGLLSTLQLRITGHSSSLNLVAGRQRYHRLGDTSIQITEDASDTTSVFVNDGKNVMRVSLLQGSGDGQYAIDDIWFTDRNNPSFGNPTVHAMVRLPDLPQWSMQGLERAFICSINESMLFTSLGTRSQAVPRRLPLKGNPFRLVYLEHLQKLAVGVEITTITKSRTRCTRPGIEIVDIDESDDDQQEVVRLRPSPYLIGKVGERITCITHWTPKAQEKQYGLIVLGTRLEHNDPSSCDGRLIFATADKVGHDLKVRHKRTYRFTNRPVYSLASYGDSSLIVGLGQSLVLQSLDFESRRWQRKAEYHLPSPALQISVVESDIYVTTAQHSVVRLKLSSNHFVPATSDKQSRNGVSHTTLRQATVMASSGFAGGTITGFAHDSERTFTTLFEVCVPHNITRLKKACGPASGFLTGEHFYASTIDGLVYDLTILSEAEWRALHFVQTLQREDQGSLFKRFAASKTMSKARAARLQPTDMHIDGDSLGALVARGSAYLRDILSDHTVVPSAANYGLLSPKEKIRYFEEVMDNVAHESADPIESFLTWARQLLGVAA